MKNNNIHIPKLSFYWRVKKHFNDKNPVPNFLPFESDYESRLRLIIQKRNKNTLRYLEKVYQDEPNIGHNQGISNWKKLYGNDFIALLENVLKSNKISSALELGCGGCLLLERLRKKKIEVLGIDPSPFARRVGSQMGIRVITDFFPSKKIKDKFDLIYHSNVLEHIQDPVAFLRNHKKYLNSNGILALAVPNCSLNVANGDISMFYHQHLSYFDKESLKLVLERAGFRVLSIHEAKFGGNLYALAQNNGSKPMPKPDFENQRDAKYIKFLDHEKRLVSDLEIYIKKVLADKKNTLGFYAPLRALPYLATLNLYKNIRFFDDTTYWHEQYFDGINIPIENFKDLKRKPVTDLMIMSPTFGDIIERKVLDKLGKRIRTRKLTDFFEIKKS